MYLFNYILNNTMIDLKDKKILREFKKNVKKNLEEYYTKDCYDEYGWENGFTHIVKSDHARKLYTMYTIVIDNASEIITKNTNSSIKTESIFYIGRYCNVGCPYKEIKYIKYSGLINSILKLYDSKKRVVSTNHELKLFSFNYQCLKFTLANKK